jgi:hypothetical protein
LIGYIYKTTNLINGKIYIGQHITDKFEPKYLGSGLKIIKAIKKYGKENFKVELLHESKNLQRLDSAEIFYIEEYEATNPKIGYNILIGGQNYKTNKVLNIAVPITYGDKNSFYLNIDEILSILTKKNQALFIKRGIKLIELFIVQWLIYIYKTKQYINILENDSFYITHKTFLRELPALLKNQYSLQRIIGKINKRKNSDKLFIPSLIKDYTGTRTYFKLNKTLLFKIGWEI